MTIAIIQTHSEHDEQTWLGQDMLLALASHDLNPQLILSGAGVLQGCYGHDAQRQQRSLHKRYGLLELFECPNPWILRSDLERFQLTVEDFIFTVDVIEPQDWEQRLAAVNKVLVY